MELQTILSAEAKTQLRTWLQPIRGANIRFRTLYQSHVHGLAAPAFHARCNNQGPTVSVAQLKNGAVFGGYTSRPWSNVGVGVADPTAFVFRLYAATGFNPVKYDVDAAAPGVGNAIQDDAALGPQFGSGPDLLLFPNGASAFTGANRTYQLPPANPDLELAGTANAWDIATVEVFAVETLQPTLIDDWNPISWTLADADTRRNELLQKEPPTAAEFFNILLFGGPGLGKSSLYSSIQWALTQHYTQIAEIGKGVATTTKVLSKLPANSDVSGFKMRIWDTMGATTTTYGGGALDLIIEGRVPHGFNLDQPINGMTPGLLPTSAVGLPDQVHLVIMFANATDPNNHTYHQTLQPFRNSIRGYGIPVLVALTAIDLCDEAVAKDTALVYKSKAVKDAINDCAQKMSLNPNQVFPIKNYREERQSRHSNNILILDLLEHAVAACKSYYYLKGVQ